MRHLPFVEAARFPRAWILGRLPATLATSIMRALHPEPEAMARKRVEVMNCGFEKAEHLPPNIGYLTISPITKTDWEGVGVEPDVKVTAADALTEALKRAREVQPSAQPAP